MEPVSRLITARGLERHANPPHTHTHTHTHTPKHRYTRTLSLRQRHTTSKAETHTQTHTNPFNQEITAPENPPELTPVPPLSRHDTQHNDITTSRTSLCRSARLLTVQTSRGPSQSLSRGVLSGHYCACVQGRSQDVRISSDHESKVSQCFRLSEIWTKLINWMFLN